MNGTSLMRYGMTDPRGSDLHAIWGLTNTSEIAALSLAVLAAYAIGLTYLAIRIFTHTALQ